jgi:hypothetical protein
MKKKTLKRKLRAYKKGIKWGDVSMYIAPDGTMTVRFKKRVKMSDNLDDHSFVFTPAPD